MPEIIQMIIPHQAISSKICCLKPSIPLGWSRFLHAESRYPHSFARRESVGRAPCTKGFTLLELLAVVAILAVLVALVMVMGNRVLERAAAPKCMANMRQVYSRLVTYAGENNGFFPPAYKTNAEGQTMGLWAENMRDQGYFSDAELSYAQRRSSPLFCPSSTAWIDSPLGWRVGNYGINANVAGRQAGPSSPIVDGTPLSAIPKAASTLLLFDSGIYFLFQYDAKNPRNLVTYLPGASVNTVITAANKRKDAMEGRHSGKVHAAFLDGHIETFAADDLIERTELWLPK